MHFFSLAVCQIYLSLLHKICASSHLGRELWETASPGVALLINCNTCHVTRGGAMKVNYTLVIRLL